MKNLFKKEIHNSLFYTNCCYCNKEIVVNIPVQCRIHKSFSCNNCVPENSAARDGINESIFIDISNIN